MYHQYYGLSEDPFLLSPNHRFCLRHPSFSKAKAYMEYALERNEGFAVITGGPGTGKTTLIDDLLEDLYRSDINIARLVSARLEGDEILSMVGYAFKIPVDGMGKTQILYALQQYAESHFRQGRRSVLVVDEAQGLTHEALEELRLLTNLRIGGVPLLQIFLVGQEELHEKLVDKRLEQLNQRIIAACHLESLTLEQVVMYVLHRLRVAGWQGHPKLNPELFPLLYEFSFGIPRRINIACSRMMLLGSLEQKSELTKHEIQVAISELRTEHLYRSDVATHPVVDNVDLVRLAEVIEENTPAQPETTRGAGKVESEPLSVMLETEPDTDPKPEPEPEPEPEPSVQAVPDRVVELSLPEEQPVLSHAQTETRPPLRDEKGSRLAPFWGFAASLLLIFSIMIIALVSVSPKELLRVAPESFWSAAGITSLRAQVSSWTEGAWPPGGMAKRVSGDAERQVASLTPVEALERASAEVSEPLATEENRSSDSDSTVIRIERPAKQPEEKLKAVQHSGTTEERDSMQAEQGAPVVEEPVSDAVLQVVFDFDSDVLQPKFEVLLDEIASTLNSRKESRVQIIGFTDSVGDHDYNTQLSERRASAVADYLKRQGVPDRQLEIEGRGEAGSIEVREGTTSTGRVVRLYFRDHRES
ncbi:MAG: OmpA family protein [Sedimenticola sp.]